MVVDVCGHLLTVVVHAASVQDFHGARLVLQKLAQQEWKRLEKILADGIYKGDQDLKDWIRTTLGWELEVVERAAGQKGFQIIPKRWVVERTFAWLGRNRRLSKDYEFLPETSETWLYIAMVALLTRRLALSP
jgi:putative transposase